MIRAVCECLIFLDLGLAPATLWLVSWFMGHLITSKSLGKCPTSPVKATITTSEYLHVCLHHIRVFSTLASTFSVLLSLGTNWSCWRYGSSRTSGTPRTARTQWTLHYWTPGGLYSFQQPFSLFCYFFSLIFDLKCVVVSAGQCWRERSERWCGTTRNSGNDVISFYILTDHSSHCSLSKIPALSFSFLYIKWCLNTLRCFHHWI